MRTFIGILVLLMATPTVASADYLFVTCLGDSLHFAIATQGYFEDPTGQSLHIRGAVIGECGSEFEVTKDPFPFPPYQEFAYYSLTCPALYPDRYVSYRLYRVDPEGNEFSVPNSGDALPYDREACTPDAIFSRGRLWDLFGSLRLELCEDHCWVDTEFWFSEAEDGWEAFVNTGQVVNVYGEAYVDGMPGATGLAVSRVMPEESPDGCEALDVEDISWGSVKARYR